MLSVLIADIRYDMQRGETMILTTKFSQSQVHIEQSELVRWTSAEPHNSDKRCANTADVYAPVDTPSLVCEWTEMLLVHPTLPL